MNGTMRAVASWISGLFGLGLILLVIADLIWDEDSGSNRAWQILTAITGVVIIVAAFMFLANNMLGGFLLLIGLVAGGFLSFWTIAGIVWAGVAFILVMWALMTGSGNGNGNEFKSGTAERRSNGNGGNGGYYQENDNGDRNI